MKIDLNKKIIFILLTALIILGVGFVYSKEKKVSEFKEISIVENIVYVGEDISVSPAVLDSDEKENIELENMEVKNWFSAFVNNNIEQQKPKERNVPGDYSTIQGAIHSAKFGDVVKVESGEYKENIIMKQGVNLIGTEKLICIDGKFDVKFECTEEEIALGGFVSKQDDGTYDVDLLNQVNTDIENKEVEELTREDELTETDELIDADEKVVIKIRERLLSSVIDGDGSGNVVTFKNDNIKKNELSGFIIRNSGKSLNGVYVETSSPWIHDNIIIDNEFGIYVKGESYPVIQKNIIQFSSKGIQVYNFEKLEIESEILEEEVIIEKKEAMLHSDTDDIKLIIVDNLITDNKTGIDINKSAAYINHNTISYNNHYKIYLGATYGINLSDSTALIINNIVTDSGVCELCAGVNVDKKSKGVVLKYNNIWNNKNDYVCYGDCELTESNLSEDPLFVDAMEGDYKLSEDSGSIGKSEDELDIGVRW